MIGKAGDGLRIPIEPLKLPGQTATRYGFGVLVLGLPVIGLCSALSSLSALHATGFLLLLSVAVAMSFFPTPVSSVGVALSPVLPVAMTALYRFGPLPAVLVAIAAAIAHAVFVSRRPVPQPPRCALAAALHGIGQQSVAVGLVAAAYQSALRAGAFAAHSFVALLAICLASLAAYYLAAFLSTTVAAKSFATRWDVVWYENYRWTSRAAVLLAPLGFFSGALSEQNLALGTTVLVICLIAAMRGFTLHARKIEVYQQGVDLLGRLMQEAHPYTHGHLSRVATWAKKIADRVGLSARSMTMIESAAILHDIGKVAIDDRVLNKAERLSEVDWATIKEHPVIGEQIVAKMHSLGCVASWIRHHHERFDGMGYPEGLTGDAIPVESRIIAVVDAFDAMVGGPADDDQRPYRRALSYEDAAAELRHCAGTQFDPTIVDAFLAILDDEGCQTGGPTPGTPAMMAA
jgi:hypothetical protein